MALDNSTDPSTNFIGALLWLRGAPACTTRATAPALFTRAGPHGVVCARSDWRPVRAQGEARAFLACWPGPTTCHLASPHHAWRRHPHAPVPSPQGLLSCRANAEDTKDCLILVVAPAMKDAAPCSLAQGERYQLYLQVPITRLPAPFCSHSDDTRSCLTCARVAAALRFARRVCACRARTARRAGAPATT